MTDPQPYLPLDPSGGVPDPDAGPPDELSGILDRFRHFLFRDDIGTLPAARKTALVREAMHRTQGYRTSDTAVRSQRWIPSRGLAWAALLLVCVGLGWWGWRPRHFAKSGSSSVAETGDRVLGVVPLEDDPDVALGMNGAPLDERFGFDGALELERMRLHTPDSCTPFQPVRFDAGSATIPPEEQAKIVTIAKVLQANREATLVIEGYCDQLAGGKAYPTLGERRALAVCACLVSQGIDTLRITNVGYSFEDAMAQVDAAEASRLVGSVRFILIRQ